jgi:transposase-like protein
MPRNIIQFQKGLSLHTFLKQYGEEAQCREALYQQRWPNGFVCPECGNTTGCELKSRKLYQCHRCHHQTSLTAGTIFHGSKLPLSKWFLAIYLLTQHKKSVAILQLMRDLGVQYNTAWKLKHKLMQVMFERQQEKTLAGVIELDDAYLGGEKAGKRGRGSVNKIPFVAAVETRDGWPIWIQLRRVKGFRKTCIAGYAQHSITPGSLVYSDGLSCFRASESAGCHHIPIVTGSGRPSPYQSTFKWVNTVLGNVKSAIRGSFHSVSEKHAPRYLAEFEYRFNRRFDLPSMITRLLVASVRTPPMPYRMLKMAEVYA